MNKQFPKSGVFIALCVVVGFAQACSLAGVPPPSTSLPTITDTLTPTAIPTRTSTPTTTHTPIPSATPSPTVTPTRTLSSMQVESMRATEYAARILPEIKAELEKLGLPEEGGRLGGYFPEPIELMVDTYQGVDGAWPFLQDLNYSSSSQNPSSPSRSKNFVLQTDVMWESTGGLAYCNLFLRVSDPMSVSNYYFFNTIRLTGLPAYGVSRVEDSKVTKDFTDPYLTSELINQENGSTNTYLIYFYEDKLNFYANGEKLKTFTDNKITDGFIGFGVYQNSGITTCTFSNIWYWILD